ncbi:hypothetical protein FACS1894186_2950 [Alphaproteobacteria bacterium]|nr:hypothetical protein FACS1894186_2950 [Alphaproteobacteria bacterium]
MMSLEDREYVEMNNLETADRILRNDFADIVYPTADTVYSTAIVQSPEILTQTKCGHCWEQTELARFLFKQKGIPCKTYYADDNKGDGTEYGTHTFLVFEYENNFYWFEHAWGDHAGIYCYNSLKELLIDIKQKWADTGKELEYLRFFEYNEPELPTAHMKFINHCTKGKLVKIEEL